VVENGHFARWACRLRWTVQRYIGGCARAPCVFLAAAEGTRREGTAGCGADNLFCYLTDLSQITLPYLLYTSWLGLGLGLEPWESPLGSSVSERQQLLLGLSRLSRRGGGAEGEEKGTRAAPGSRSERSGSSCCISP
jgi:hypothetical protein